MLYDLDKQTEAAPAWDFAVSLGGITYPLRQVTLKEFNDLSNRRLTREQDVAYVASLFPPDRQPPQTLLDDDDARHEVNSALAAYVEASVEKKQQAVRARVRAALGLR